MQLVSGEETLPLLDGEWVPREIPLDQARLEGELERTEGTIEGFLDPEEAVYFPLVGEEKGAAGEAEDREILLELFVRSYDWYEGVVGFVEVSIGKRAIACPLYGATDPQPLFFPLTIKPGEDEVRVRSDWGGTYLELTRILVWE